MWKFKLRKYSFYVNWKWGIENKWLEGKRLHKVKLYNFRKEDFENYNFVITDFDNFMDGNPFALQKWNFIYNKKYIKLIC
jgi:hypothetical protein